MIVDPATGAMWDIKENNMVLNLSPLALREESVEPEPDKAELNEEEKETI